MKFLLSFISLVVYAAASTLVLHDGSIDFESDYSLFLNDYKTKFENELVFKNVKEDTTIKIVSEVDSSQNLYDDVIVFPIAGRSLGNKKLSATDFLKFNNNKNGNILIVSSENSAAEEIRVFLNQLGVFPSPKQYKLYDHFSFEESHDVLKVPVNENLLDSENTIIDETLKTDDILYFGNSALLSNNELLIPILSAPKTSFNFNPKKVDKKSTDGDSKFVNDINYWGLGNQNYLIVGFQNLVNSRVGWIGSSEFISDEYYKQSNYKNEKIFNDLLAWTFGNKNILKVSYVEFFKTFNNTFNPKLLKDTFKVTDEVVYTIGLSELKNGEWVGYEADDIQLEFTMLDPYYRLTLQKIPSDSEILTFNSPDFVGSEPNTTYFAKDFVEDTSVGVQYYSAKFQLPDQHGMFKYLFTYNKPGYSFLKSENIITLRNLAFDEYLKSSQIVNSWVYLSAIITLISGWIVFLTLFLFGGQTKKVTVAKKNN